MITMRSVAASRSRSGNNAMTGVRSIGLLIVGLAMAALAPAHAQTALKIGVVNFGRLVEQAPQAEAVTKKLQTEFGSRQAELEAKQKKLETQQETFRRDSAVMGEEERLNLERQIRDGQRELQRDQNEYLEDLNIRRNEEVGKLQRDILQRVQAYASTQKYDLVVGDAIYFSGAVDITADVLKALQTQGAAPPGAGQ
jgi:outer membrane protein